MIQGWQEVNIEFMRRITEREWRTGELIPTESDLAIELGCSRVTVNRALRDLAEKGLLDRKRKKGTRVVKNPERKVTFTIPVTRLEVEGLGAHYQHNLLKRKLKIPPKNILKRMRMAPGSRMLYLYALHLADQKPFALEERWVNLSVVPELEMLDLSELSANEWLVNNASFSGGELSLGAFSADPVVAQLMKCEVGDALFEVERTTWTEDQMITCVRLLYTPNYRLHTRL